MHVEAHGHETAADDGKPDASDRPELGGASARPERGGSEPGDGPASDRTPPTSGASPAEIQSVVDALDDKRAKDIVVLDLHGVSASLDWFVIATGESALQLRALDHGVRDELKEQGVRPRGVEGPSDRWVLLDYGSIVVHLMSPDARAFYDLEGLWADAERIDVTPA